LERSAKRAIIETNILKGEERKQCVPFFKFIRQVFPEFGIFLLNQIPTIDQLTFFRANEQYFLKQYPESKSIQFFDSKTVSRSEIPARQQDGGIKELCIKLKFKFHQ
jgi:hypothetical protein